MSNKSPNTTKAVTLTNLVLDEPLPNIGLKSSRDKQLQLRNPLREKDKNSRLDSGRKVHLKQVTDVIEKGRPDKGSAKDKLAYILGRPQGGVRNVSRNDIDRYISIEQNPGDDNSKNAGKIHSYERVNDYPSYRKNDEISRIRIHNENIRAQSSKRLPSSNVKPRYNEYSLQPKYNAHSRNILQKQLEKQRAAMALDPYKQYQGRPQERENSSMEARILRGVRIQGAEPERYNSQRPQIIKRPEYYPKLKEASYVYHQPDWWG